MPSVPSGGLDARDLDRAFREALDAQRMRVGAWTNTYRLAGVTAWLAIALFAGGRVPHWRSQVPLLAAYLAVALGILILRRWSDLARRITYAGLAVVDVPMIYLLQRQTVAYDPYPDATARFSLAMFLVLVLVSMTMLRRRLTVVTALLGGILEIALVEQGGVAQPERFNVELAAAAMTLFAAVAAVRGIGRATELVRATASEQIARARLHRYFSPQVAARLGDT
ncbi:MAG: hypothetical protein ACRELB_22660, partial [Polyangiaceae bacterium]